jgi:hypothetical protein
MEVAVCAVYHLLLGEIDDEEIQVKASQSSEEPDKLLVESLMQQC